MIIYQFISNMKFNIFDECDKTEKQLEKNGIALIITCIMYCSYSSVNWHVLLANVASCPCVPSLVALVQCRSEYFFNGKM